MQTLGPGKCAGKALALQEMQLVLSALVRQFDIKFAPSYRPQKWWEDMNDYFVFVNGKLNVVIEERKQK
jgi:cytochrome P450